MHLGTDFLCFDGVTDNSLETSTSIRLSLYTQISDSDLDGVMTTLVRRFPNNGTSIIWGHLRSLNITVTRARVQDSLLRVSASSVRLR